MPRVSARSVTHISSARMSACSNRSRVLQYRGCSHIDSLDLDPDSAAETRGPFKPIATNVPGIRIGEHLPKLAQLADRFTIVRSMSHVNGGHDGGMHVAMTGHCNPK